MESEKCQCCGESGQDRRTLHMSCLYDMSELSIPFVEHVEIDPHTKKVKLREHRLQVCKDCRGDWLRAIEKWFLDNHNKRKEIIGSERVTHEEAIKSFETLQAVSQDSADWLRAMDIVGTYLNQEIEHLKRKEVKMFTREEAKEAIGELVSMVGSLGHCNANCLLDVLVGYLNQKPEDLDAEVWAEVETLRQSLREVTGKIWNVDGVKNGKWGVYTLDQRGSRTGFKRAIGHNCSPEEIRDELADELVKVLSRRKQSKCQHVFERRRWQDIKSNWASVCSRCGMTARGPR